MSQKFLRNGIWLTSEQMVDYNKKQNVQTKVKNGDKVTKKEVKDVTTPIDTIEQLRVDYKKKIGNDVPSNMKNNEEWIKSKLN